ncbi:CheR family methyltransferase [Janthinobacterium agaricidamnosum]|uniref:CheR methyltransferase, SAM binding domain protein n=1 Tax=Janthinobacterium agaricidamnosum NBRC 102515 = DSM 9628 TaxID=1349767 RepID=W0VAY7_9BURK|nr:CheR family methyltransferase [Janthinobacterium agaricidamnosum]CDG84518.1 cheR methyltransferase, SAM binding domain protein [Janthinobacterium agaricidamnosum NBRC 102515 = DSM 9628]
MSIQSLLRQASGLSVSKSVAERAVRQRMEHYHFADIDAYLEALTPGELSQLIELVVVPESWLFRDPQAFYASVELVRERWSQQRITRILTIPCAGGEEPYSMVMALRDAGVPKEAFSIDAYDLSPACIERAQAGVYGRNAFRSQDPAFRERYRDRYFTHVNEDDYRILDSLRTQVKFRQGNLLHFDTATYAKYYDVVFCRNLLIYFDKPTTRSAIAKLSALLADDGMLLAGYAEVPSFCQNGFTPLQHRQAFALKKDSGVPVVAEAPKLPLPRSSPAPRPVLTSVPPTVPGVPRAAPPQAKAKAKAKAVAVAMPAQQTAANDDLLQQARRLADLGRFKEAGEQCHAHLARHPDGNGAADAYFLLGILNEHGGKMDLAEDYWRRCIYLQPDHYDAMCHLALLAEKNGNRTAAANLKARAARIYQRRLAT